MTELFTYLLSFTSDKNSSGFPPVSAAPLDVPGREAVVVALDAVVREVKPLAATFFSIGEDGEIRFRAAHGSDPPGEADWPAPRELAAGPHPIVKLDDAGPPDHVHRRIGAIDDLRLLIRDRGRPVAGIAVWRRLDGPGWSPRQLRLLGSLQPLIEEAYVSAVRVASNIDARLPPTLTRRQRQVARMLVAGATNAEVASALHISIHTAKSHSRAVLAKLGAASRREIVVRLTRRQADEELAPERRDEAAGHLLSLVLDWAAERTGAAAGGCALFSARLEIVAQACDTARTGARHLDRALVQRVQRLLFPSARPSEIVERAIADRPRSSVLELDLAAAAPGSDALVTKLGLTPPLLAVLRLQGRLAGLIWLSDDARVSGPRLERVQPLRGLHSLLELASARPLAVAHGSVSTSHVLAGRGLTPRELSVARLALGGQSNADIATRLEISQSTVKDHMTRILAKCGVRSRTQLIALFAEGGEP